jgi:5-methylcytosine-specific restriction enzyme subunit McrC
MATILPGMQTDIELNHIASGRRIIIDTKFTHIFTKSDYREAMLKSGYLYQMYAYLRTQEQVDDQASLCSEGILYTLR